jgi:hypothetical protein
VKVQPALEKWEPSAGVDKVVTFGLPSPPVNRCHCRSNQSSHSQGWCPSAKNLNYLRFNSRLACIRLVTTKVKHKSCKETEKSSTLAQLQGRAKGAWKPPWPPPLPVQIIVLKAKVLPCCSPIRIYQRHQRRINPKDTEDSGDRLEPSIYHQVSLIEVANSNKTDCCCCTPTIIAIWNVETAQLAAGQLSHHGWHLSITEGRALSFRQKVSIHEKSGQNGVEEIQNAATTITERVAVLAHLEEAALDIPCKIRALRWPLKAKSIQLSASCQRIQEKSQKEGSPTEDARRLICQASKGPQDGSLCLQEYRKNILRSLLTLNGSIFSW